jgi:hypothetical protein
VVKCSGVLQCSDGLSNKVSNIIRRPMDNMKLLLICILPVLLSYSLGSTFYQCIQGVPGGKDLTTGECFLGQTIPI